MFAWYLNTIMWLQVHHIFTMILILLLTFGLFGIGLWAMRKYMRIINDSYKLPPYVQSEFTTKSRFYMILSTTLFTLSFIVMVALGLAINSNTTDNAILTRTTHYQVSTRYAKVVVPTINKKQKTVLLHKNNKTIILSTSLPVSEKTIYVRGKSYALVEVLKLNTDATSLQKTWYKLMVTDNWANGSFTTSGIKITYYESFTK